MNWFNGSRPYRAGSRRPQQTDQTPTRCHANPIRDGQHQRELEMKPHRSTTHNMTERNVIGERKQR